MILRLLTQILKERQVEIEVRDYPEYTENGLPGRLIIVDSHKYYLKYGESAVYNFIKALKEGSEIGR